MVKHDVSHVTNTGYDVKKQLTVGGKRISSDVDVLQLTDDVSHGDCLTFNDLVRYVADNLRVFRSFFYCGACVTAKKTNIEKI